VIQNDFYLFENHRLFWSIFFSILLKKKGNGAEVVQLCSLYAPFFLFFVSAFLLPCYPVVISKN